MLASLAGLPSARSRRAQHVLVGGALAAVAAVSWAKLIEGSAMDATAEAGVFLGMWLAMVGAMMLPTIEPMLVAHLASTRAMAVRRRALLTAAFVVPYLALWSAAGLLALAVMTAAGELPLLRPVLVVAVGLYQFGALKQSCLRSCRSPLGFFLRYGTGGGTVGGSAQLGLRHALVCFGCCAGLMFALSAVGSVALTWMVAFGLLMFLEKIHRAGLWLSRAAGALLIIVAPLVALVRPDDPLVGASGLLMIALLGLVALVPRPAPHPSTR